MSKTQTSYFMKLTEQGDYICPDCGVIILLTDANNRPRAIVFGPVFAF